jgi:hypothetical protein
MQQAADVDVYLEWCFIFICRPRSWPVSPRMIDVLEKQGLSTSPAHTPQGERITVFVEDRAMCGRNCSGRSSTGGVRDVAREVAQNSLEWMSSAVASSKKCTKQGSCTSYTANQEPYQG